MTWISENIDMFFSADGPFQSFRPIGVERFRRNLKACEELARRMYHQDHSNDTTGAAQEDVPAWAQVFHRFFDEVSATETRHQRAACSRAVMQVNVRSLAGAQAPLGYDGRGPAELRTETTRNEGDPSERVRSVGNVEVEIVQAPPNDADANADNLVEGRNDVVNVQPLPAREGGVGRGRGGQGRRSAGHNVITYRNVHRGLTIRAHGSAP